MKFIAAALLMLSGSPQTFAQPTLEKHKIFNDQVQISIPSTFHVMKEDEKMTKYGKVYDSSVVIFTDRLMEVNVLLNNRTNVPVTANGLKDYNDQQFEYIKEKYPEAKLIKKGSLTVHGSAVTYFQADIKIHDGSLIRNYYFFTILKGHLLLGSLNCKLSLLPDWEKPFEDIVSSVTWL